MKKKILSLILAVVLFIPMSIVKASDITIDQIVTRLNERISGNTSYLNNIGSNAVAEKTGDNIIRVSVPVTPSKFGQTEDTYFFVEYTYQDSTLSTAMTNSFGIKVGDTSTYYTSEDMETYYDLEDYVDAELKEMIYVAYNIKTENSNYTISLYLEENELEYAGHIVGTNNPPVGITMSPDYTISANLDEITIPTTNNNNNTNTNSNSKTAYLYGFGENDYSISFVDDSDMTHNFRVISFMDTYMSEKENGATEEEIADYESTLKSMQTLLKDKGNLIDMYSITVVYANSNAVNINGDFELGIKMTDEMKKYDTYKFVIIDNYYTNPTIGEVIEATKDGDYLEGTLPRLGTIALVGSNTPVENPKTGVTSYATAGLLSLITLGGIYILYKNKMSKI